MQPTKQQLIITGTIAVAGIIGYAIYTDLARFFPKKGNGCDKSKCKDNECC